MGQRTPTLTAVRRARSGRVELEVDGERWRRVPEEVVLRCGLAPGIALDRPLLRALRRELRRTEALDAAVRTVARRDVSAHALRGRLAARGVSAPVAEGAVATLAAAGVVDDARTAQARAEALAGKGWGDAAIAARLAQEGFAGGDVQTAIHELVPEDERARPLAARAGDARTAWKLLARRGFAYETMESVLGRLDEDC
jgi:SOS response regulatory protein OraA/RecX